MPAARDYTGARFGRLTAVEPTAKRHGTMVVWRCRCDCGQDVYVDSGTLGRWHGKDACSLACDGCRGIIRIANPGVGKAVLAEDLSGRRFGRLVAKRYAGGNDGAVWECECDCGNVCNVGAHELLNGNTSSCGCGNDDNRGLIGSRAPHEDGTHLGVIKGLKEPRSNTGITGVTRTRSGRYVAKITLRGKAMRLGTFDALEDAAHERRNAEKELFEPILEENGYTLLSDDEFDRRLAEALKRDRRETVTAVPSMRSKRR